MAFLLVLILCFIQSLMGSAWTPKAEPSDFDGEGFRMRRHPLPDRRTAREIAAGYAKAGLGIEDPRPPTQAQLQHLKKTKSERHSEKGHGNEKKDKGIMEGWLPCKLLGGFLFAGVFPVLVKDGLRPFMVVISYIISLCLVKICVRDVMHNGFPYPCILTALHMALTILAACLMELPNIRDAMPVLPISLLGGMSLILNNSALGAGTAAFVTMIGCSTTAVTFFLEVVTNKDKKTASSFFFVSLVCIGAAFCVNGEKQFSASALALALAANVFRSCKTVLQHSLIQADLPPCRMVAWMGIWSLLLLIPITAINEGARPWHAFFTIEGRIKLSIAASGVMAMTLNICQIYALKHLGPTTQNMTGQMHVMLVLMIATAGLHETVTWRQWIGVSMMTCGCMFMKIKVAASQPLQQAKEHRKSMDDSDLKLPGSNPKRDSPATDAAAICLT